MGLQKQNGRILPPVYFFVAVVTMVVLRFLFPFVHWAYWPWNLVGIVPILVGAAIVGIADKQFKTHQTTVKPFQLSSALVTDGVFGFSRNPMYLGMILILTGLGICLASLASLLIIPVFGWWITVRFIAIEERSLADQFGETYSLYKRRVRRWL